MVSARDAGFIFMLVVGAAACGRKATAADCQRIADRVVEVEMRAIRASDPAAVDKKKDELRPQLAEELKDCVGRRITDGLMKCVGEATTPEEMQECLR